MKKNVDGEWHGVIKRDKVIDVNINELVMRAKEGDINARDELVISNINFIKKVISDTVSVFKYPNIDYSDLVQECCIAMIDVIDNFDINKNVQFLTYAYYAIRSCVLNTLANDTRFVRIPKNVYWNLVSYISFCDKYIKEKSIKPCVDEIAKNLDLDNKHVLYLEKLVKNVVSLEEINNSLLYDDEFDDVMCNKIWHEQLCKKLNFVFDKLKLSDRTIEIIKLRYGYYGRVYGLKEIANIYNISHQRVNEIINKTIDKIKLTNCCEELVGFTYDEEKCMREVSEFRNKNIRRRKFLNK